MGEALEKLIYYKTELRKFTRVVTMNMTMKSFLSCKLFFSFALLTQADTITLFDGESLKGWDGDAKFWSVQDGVITGKSTKDVPCKKSTFLVYKEKEFENFELTLSFRFLTEEANGGILYRSQWPDENVFRLSGYQADMATDAKFNGILYESGGRKYLAQRGEKVVIDAEGKKSVTELPDPLEAEKAQRSIRHGEWNEYRVVADGHTLMHQINGHTTIQLEDNEKNRASARGLLALQLHSGAPVTVQYKDIKMLELVDTDLTGDVKTKLIEPSAEPQWIWAGVKDGEKVIPSKEEKLIFRTEFHLDDVRDRFYIGVNADDSCLVRLNGRTIIAPDNWRESEVLDAAGHLRKGENKLVVELTNKKGHGGFIMQASDVLVSDTSWRCTTKSKEQLVTYSQGANGVKPWGKVLAPLVWEKPDVLQTLDGFKADKIYNVDKATEGSWVAMCFDDKGNLFVSDQYGALYRITLKDGKVASKQKLKAIGYAQGLCWAYDSLYVVSSRKEKAGIHRLTDTNGDGEFDKDEFILPIIGRGEHGTHGLIKNPNGEGLILVVGNHTHPPENAKSLSDGNWKEDTLHPHLNDASGHAVGRKAPGGTLLLLSPDGKQRRIIARGMRNIYDIAASPTGEIFGYDSDMEYDVGTPWYKPTRVLHMVEGAEFGWRTGTAKWPAYYADSLDSVIDIGPGCPTGVTFGTGAKFPAKYQNALFIQDWTFGRIYALHLQPDGVSYSADKEIFVSGKPLPLTDMAIGPDGAMYFLTGGRRLRSGLYRVSYEGSESTEAVPNAEISNEQKLLKKVQQSRQLGEIWKYLGSEDRTLRYVARTSLEQLEVAEWLSRYQKESDPQVIITASLALSRSEVDLQLILNELIKVDYDSLSEDEQLEYIRAVSLACIRSGKPEGTVREKLLAKFKGYPSGDRMLNRELCRMLVYLDSDVVLGKTLFLMKNSVVVKEDIPADLLAGHDKYGKDILKMLRNQPDAQGLHYALMLKNQKVGWDQDSVRDYYQWLVQAASKTGGNSYKGFIQNIRTEAMKNLSPELARVAEEVTREYTKKFQPESKEETPVAKGPGKVWTYHDAVKVTKDLSGADVVNGKRMFQAILCAKCHTYSGSGGSSGPELTQLANRFTSEDILKAIIEPSEVISDQYVNTEIHMNNGTVLSGKVMKEVNGIVYLAVNPFDLTVQTQVKVSEIKKRTKSVHSSMPPSLINALNEKELKDLMLFLTQSN